MSQTYEQRIKSILDQMYVDPNHLEEMRQQLVTRKEQFEYLEDLLASFLHEMEEERPYATFH